MNCFLVNALGVFGDLFRLFFDIFECLLFVLLFVLIFALLIVGFDGVCGVFIEFDIGNRDSFEVFFFFLKFLLFLFTHDLENTEDCAKSYTDKQVCRADAELWRCKSQNERERNDDDKREYGELDVFDDVFPPSDPNSA